MRQALINMYRQSAFLPLGGKCFMIGSELALPSDILVLNQPQNDHEASEIPSDSSSAL